MSNISSEFSVRPMIPPYYVCGECEAQGVKLWRRYGVAIDSEILRCGACASKHEGAPLDLSRSQSCGGLCPAVPRWGEKMHWYSHHDSPAEAVAWWEALPVRFDGEWRVWGGTLRWIDREAWRALSMPLVRSALSGDRLLVFFPDDADDVTTLRGRLAVMSSEIESLRARLGGAA